MSLKNTYTKTPVANMLGDIQKALIRIGAIGMNYQFDGTGKIIGLAFGLKIKDKPVGFTLPINLDKFKQALKNDGNKRFDDDEYVFAILVNYFKGNIVLSQANV